MPILLGDTVKCKVTDFVGVAYSRIEYLNGCIQFDVRPKVDKDGKAQDGLWIDIQQLEVLNRPKAREAAEDTPAITGGAMRKSTNY